MRTLPFLLCLTLAPIAEVEASPTHARGARVEVPRLGLELDPPSTWRRVPVPPREEHVELMWALPSEGGRTPSVAVAVLYADDDEGVVDTKSFLERRVRPQSFEVQRAGGPRFGHDPVRYTYTQTDAEGRALRGFLHGWEASGRTVIVQGLAAADQYETHRRSWERFARGLVFETPREHLRERNAWTRYYAQRRFPDRERRIAARLSSVEGWDARDSEHYLVLSHAGDPALTRRFLDRLEALRRRLVRDFEGIAGSARTGVVRICRDREEYLLYGGDPRAWGYFSPSEGELVLHLVESEAATLRTLQHEAFHQFVFHATGGVAPHSWFDEGLAEHYGTATIQGNRVVGYEAPEDMQRTVRAFVEAERTVPLDVFLAMDQQAYYADPHRCYPQGWALVRWLELEARGRARNLLDTYFDELVRSWTAAQAALAERPDPDAWQAARAKARRAALEAALRDQDLRSIERRWLEALGGSGR